MTSKAPKYGFKRIADPVHGTVGLSQLETDLLSTQACQRLRNVKQLGLAHYVFPGADYSRLSHCIGACHVTGQILDSLDEFSPESISSQEHQQYRLAGLLHDLGHYPFSHTFEDAVSTYYDKSASLLVPDTTNVAEGQQNPLNDVSVDFDPPLGHEDVGRLLLKYDMEITEILTKYQIDPESIYSIFARKDPPRFANLISSDLDADRIDYLLRTAQHTGLPYGSVDIEYILSQIRLDSSNRICLTRRALHTAEHFLLGRYFDYQQVSYHKTVAALELVLEDVVVELFERGLIDCSKESIIGMIESGQWYEFDDTKILSIIRQLGSENISDSLKLKVRSLSRRVPPKLIGSIEFIGNRDRDDDHRRNIRQLMRVCDNLSIKFNVDRDLWYVWDSKGRSLTKIGSHVPVSMLPADADDLEQAIRIINGDQSTAIVEVKQSLMSILAQNALYTSRLYVLLPQDRESDRDAIMERAKKEMDHHDWIDAKS